jgi:hypothetical protein
VPVQCKKALPRNERERNDGEEQKINKNKILYKMVYFRGQESFQEY